MVRLRALALPVWRCGGKSSKPQTSHKSANYQLRKRERRGLDDRSQDVDRGSKLHSPDPAELVTSIDARAGFEESSKCVYCNHYALYLCIVFFYMSSGIDGVNLWECLGPRLEIKERTCDSIVPTEEM